MRIFPHVWLGLKTSEKHLWHLGRLLSLNAHQARCQLFIVSCFSVIARVGCFMSPHHTPLFKWFLINCMYFFFRLPIAYCNFYCQNSLQSIDPYLHAFTLAVNIILEAQNLHEEQDSEHR